MGHSAFVFLFRFSHNLHHARRATSLRGALPRESVCRRDQGAAVRRIECAMAAVGRDDEVGLGPGTMQRPGALHRADDIVSALHDHPGNLADPRGVAQQLVVGFKETFVEK